jgi:hypothetical protein
LLISFIIKYSDKIDLSNNLLIMEKSIKVELDTDFYSR